MWFQGSDTFTDNSLNGIGTQSQNIVDTSNLQDLQTTTCDTSSNLLLQYAPCVLGQTLSLVTGALGWLWNLLTAWISVLSLSLSGLGTIGVLMSVILIPFFALTEVFAIIVIMLKLAGIIRGGS